MKKLQKGMGLVQLMVILAIATVFMNFGIKMMPVLMENMAIKQSLKQIATDARSEGDSSRSLWVKFQKFMDVNSINYIKRDNFFVIENENGSLNIGVDYEVRKEFLYNFDIVAKFKDRVTSP